VAYSYVRYTGNGTTTNYAFPFPYLSQSHVKVRVDNVLTEFTFLNSNTVDITPAPEADSRVEIRRETPRDDVVVDFVDGSTLLETDLDLLATFNLYVSQEVTDAVDEGLFAGLDDTFDAEGRMIKNLGSPVEPSDAVTKEWAETAMTSQLVQAANLVSNAEDLLQQADQIISSFTISTLDPTEGSEGDVWFKVSI
jgi:hypothetical protein